MSNGVTSSRDPRQIPESTIWVLRKGGRTAGARIRITPGGPELHCYLDGELLVVPDHPAPGGVRPIATERRMD